MRDLHSAAIIAVGSELLTPFKSDTNSLWLTARLNETGIGVRMKTIVGDDRSSLAETVRDALARADVVITTGGLGPTADDVTRDVVADILGRPLEERPEWLARIRERFDRRGVEMPAINRRQAFVPRGAEPLENTVGSAPGLLIELEDRVIVLLPGPPRELQPMFDDLVLPRLAGRTSGRRLRRRVVKVTGRSESQVEEVAFPVYSVLDAGDIPVQTTVLASPGLIELQLSASGPDLVLVDRRLEQGVARLAEALGDAVFSTDGSALELVVGRMVGERGWRIAAAESCTGGLLLGSLTGVPGSSGWVAGGVVAYGNDVKVGVLGVAPQVIERFGAVSEPVAEAMADGVRTRIDADVGVAITGIAGPGGGSAAKPVGTVVVAVSTRDATTVRTFVFPGDREAVRRHAVAAALDLVRRTMMGH